MRKILWAFTALLFFVWILPLGVFIKPGQEKKVCNGQRAICMCSHMAKPMAQNAGAGGGGELRKESSRADSSRQVSGNSGKTIYKAGGETQNEVKGASSPGQDFLFGCEQNRVHRKFSLYFQQQSTPLPFVFIRTIEHVPKA